MDGALTAVVAVGLPADTPARAAATSSRWVDAAEGAPGWAGTTAGVTRDGRFVVVTSHAGDAFRRRAAARDDVTVRTGAVLLWDVARLGGAVGFVQVVQGRVHDLGRTRVQLEQLADAVRVHLPALVGSVTVAHPAGRFTRVLHYVSEAAARASERDLPPEVRCRDEVARRLLVGPVEFLDLRSPSVRVPGAGAARGPGRDLYPTSAPP